MTHYTNSKGEAVDIATMPYTYLANAIGKLERVKEMDAGMLDADEVESLAVMQAEKAKRDAAFEASKAELIAEGYGVMLTADTYQVLDRSLVPATKRYKLEAAAWWELIEARNANS